MDMLTASLNKLKGEAGGIFCILAEGPVKKSREHKILKSGGGQKGGNKDFFGKIVARNLPRRIP